TDHTRAVRVTRARAAHDRARLEAVGGARSARRAAAGLGHVADPRRRAAGRARRLDHVGRTGGAAARAALVRVADHTRAVRVTRARAAHDRARLEAVGRARSARRAAAGLGHVADPGRRAAGGARRLDHVGRTGGAGARAVLVRVTDHTRAVRVTRARAAHQGGGLERAGCAATGASRAVGGALVAVLAGFDGPVAAHMVIDQQHGPLGLVARSVGLGRVVHGLVAARGVFN